MNIDINKIWQGQYKIPWNDADFSRRMLKEHLRQSHDLASRRSEQIASQVAFLHSEVLHKDLTQRVLDLGCGPGLYSKPLAELGHFCRGIDFSPASIEYACQQCAGMQNCDFILGDLRTVEFGCPTDMAMLLYGEFNVFSPGEAEQLLTKCFDSLEKSGKLLLEVQTYNSVRSIADIKTADQSFESGLFSESPHSCHIERIWLEEIAVSIEQFTVTETLSAKISTYRSTIRAWSAEEISTMLKRAGFVKARVCHQWPSGNDGLELWICEK